jgi:hypothetical protein
VCLPVLCSHAFIRAPIDPDEVPGVSLPEKSVDFFLLKKTSDLPFEPSGTIA